MINQLILDLGSDQDIGNNELCLGSLPIYPRDQSLYNVILVEFWDVSQNYIMVLKPYQ